MKKIFTYILIVCILLSTVSLCACERAGISANVDSPTTVAEANGMRAACVIGGLDCVVIPEHCPDSPIDYYNSIPDAIIAVEHNKADFMLNNLTSVQILMQSDNKVSYVNEAVEPQEIGFFFAKDTERADILRNQLNEYIAAHKPEFTAMRDDWVANWENREALDMNVGGSNGIIKMGIIGSILPYAVVKDGAAAGSDVEIIANFCKAYDYELVVEIYDLGALIPAVETGQLDLVGGAIGITDERKQAVNFADSHIDDPLVLVIRSEEANPTIWKELKTGFRRSFIESGRWKMVLQGLGTTIKILLCSIVLATVLGFLFYLISRKKITIINKALAFLSWLFGAMPPLIVLMLFYYVFFAKSTASGTLVSILGFGIITGFSIYNILTTSVKSVGPYQVEGALVLGLSEKEAFWQIVLPQALAQFVPNYKSALIELIHGTSIVGYIAVQDLTKSIDLIRSVTYESFFPIIASAVIYILLDVALVELTKLASNMMDPRRRTEEDINKKFK